MTISVCVGNILRREDLISHQLSILSLVLQLHDEIVRARGLIQAGSRHRGGVGGDVGPTLVEIRGDLMSHTMVGFLREGGGHVIGAAIIAQRNRGAAGIQILGQVPVLVRAVGGVLVVLDAAVDSQLDIILG